MNLRRVVYVLGLILFILAAAQGVPLLWCLWDGEARAVRGFVAGSLSSVLIGAGMRWWGTKEGELYRRDGVLIVVGAWLLASITGAIPYVVSGVLPNPADALFESASGFTTTGASVLTNIEAAGHPMLFWRSFTQWLGGIGIVVLLVALLSELGPGARFLFKLEVPGPKAEVMHSRVRDSAIALARIYLGMSFLQVVLLMAFGLDLFDALTHTFSTVSTGGFSPHRESVALFSPAVQLVITIFMLAAGVNFSLYWMALRSRSLNPFRDIELRAYLGLVAVATLLIALDLVIVRDTPAGKALLDALFQAVSILTTTGFATANFAQWPAAADAILVALMLVGGCAGSTAGGIKIVRVIIAWKAANREVRLTFSPNSVVSLVIGRSVVPEESIRSVVALLLLWIAAWGVGAMLLSIGNADIVTASTAAIATLSNIGPGLASVGPTGDFSAFANWQKLLMVLLMWLGRLEFFALLALLHPRFWRR